MTTSLDVPDKILALGYFDDKPFLRYKGDNRTAEALRPGIKGHAGAETQARETEGLWKEQLRAMLAEVTRQRSQDRGPHTLRYDLTTISLDVPDKILALGYFDDKPFLRYKGDNRTAEALTPRFKGHAVDETQARETEGLWKEQLRAMLAEVTRQRSQDRGLHTIQVTFGCELHRNGSTRGFWHLGYDGQDSITFDQKTLEWTMAVPSTKKTKNFREIYASKAAQVKTFLEGTCPAQLQKHLASSKNFLLDTGTDHHQGYFPGHRGTFLWPSGSVPCYLWEFGFSVVCTIVA
ncbi:MHC I like leukocyte 1 [Cricetulus griseus]